ncbi:homocysteine S-methyltransferase [Roseovarius marisflavi]|uniref:Homocysteine S-methyltransferase n=1 Tax=Roseovarius marisflavi TaxID=1054996 RepID=A0A1M7B6I0_9RHOB|nr:homocysteine S-methyltransferase family protein [Roseovarius marisflavi]SHL50259.1 homocysteine S-methyltransferase [Roseovarius marisflavi]
MTAITLLDGSIGQELVKRSGDRATPLWSTQVMIEHPGLVREVHDNYFAVGASVATTNTYAVLRDRLARVGLQDKVGELMDAAITAACAARDAHGSGRVAGALGPLIASYRPDICPPAEQAAVLYAEPVQMLAGRVDLLLIETMSSVDQAEGALRAAMGQGVPVWLAVSVMDEDGTRLRSGEPLGDLAPVVARHAPDAVLINCTRPEAVAPGLEIIAGLGKPFGAYSNGFTRITDGFLQDAPTVDALEQRVDMPPAAYADIAMGWLDQGATILGGCCEIGPDHIAELARRITGAGHTIV